MSELVLFHSALGLRPGVHEVAELLRERGHVVHTPDLFDGETFDELAAGAAKRDSLGIEEIARRASEAVSELSGEIAVAGFSMGAAPAQLIGQTRPGVAAVALLHGALPAEAFGCPWPRGLPLEIHGMRSDPWFDVDVASALAAEADGALHLYEGRGHLFADPDLDDYDPAAARLMLDRLDAFLAASGRAARVNG